MKRRNTQGAPTPALRLTLTGLLGATAIVLSFLETLLPPLPVPAARLGLSNVAVTAALSLFGLPCGAAVAAIKVVFALLTRGVTAAWMAGAGTLVAVAVTAALLPLRRQEALTFVGVSIASSAAHTLGQLAAATVLLGGAVTAYAPWLLLLSIPTGTVTGLVLNITVDRLGSILQKRNSSERM